MSPITLTSDILPSGALQAFGNAQIEKLRVRGRLVYGGNLADHQMLGGFVETNDGQFLNLNSWSSWLDFEYPLHPQWKLGLFGGYTGNVVVVSARTISCQMVVMSVPDCVWHAS